MALQKAVTKPSGTTLPAAYHRIIRLDLSVFPTEQVGVVVGIYNDAAARLAGKPPEDDKTIIFAGAPYTAIASAAKGGTVGGSIKAAYDEMKVTPEYTGALDV